MKTLQFSSGTIVGKHHYGTDRLFKGQRSQDSMNLVEKTGWSMSQNKFVESTVGVICDGMGSGRTTEFGAEFGALVLPQIIHDALSNTDSESFEAAINHAFEQKLKDLVRMTMPPSIGNQAAKLQDYLFFTIMGFVIHNDNLKILAAGDGIYYINGERFQIGPFPDNAPPYFVYRLLDGFDKDEHRIRIVKDIPIQDVDSFMIASDGFTDYEEAAERAILMTNGKPVPPVSDLFSSDHIAGHPEGIMRVLRLVQRYEEQRNAETGDLERIGRYLEDDTTIIIGRKIISG